MITTLKENAWIAAIVLLPVAVFRDALMSALGSGVNALGSFLYGRLAGSRMLRRRAMRRYRQGLLEATGRIHIPFRPNRPLVLDDVYTPLFVTDGESDQPNEATEALAAYRRLIVTGPPGAGKSILLRRAAARGGAADSTSERSRLPVLVELHRLAEVDRDRDSVERHIVDAFARCGFPRADKFVRVALDRGWLRLLLDGFDEVQLPDRRRVARRITDFLERERATAAVITCRTAVYRGEFDGVVDRHVELEPFEDQQIQAFLNSWNDAMPPGKSPAHLMAALRKQPKLLKAARNPLLLTIIAHLYSDSPGYMLPRSRAEFYGQAAVILLDQWQGHLGHNQFDGPDKSTVLSALAMEMQEAHARGEGDRRTISRQDALAGLSTVMPSLGMEPSRVGPMLQEIVERSGLLVLIDGGTRYTFAHLTFQEYFAAAALASRPEDLLERFARDPDTWREVVLLWCGLAADSTEMIERVNRLDEDVALACVAEARAVERGVADGILDPVLEEVRAGTASEEQQRSLGAVAADVRSRGDRVLKALVTAFEGAEDSATVVCVGEALSASDRPEAAEAIVRRLGEEPRLMPSVIRLGELGVPGLERDCLEDGSRSSCACLASIGTASAGVALARIMLKGGALATPAAWGLTSVVESPLVAGRLAELGEQELPFNYGRDPALEWVTGPLVGWGREGLVWLIGRAAYLVQQTRDLDDAIADPDPRISMALCALQPGPLDSPVNRWKNGVRELVEAANATVQGVEFGFDDSGEVMFSERDLRHGFTVPRWRDQVLLGRDIPPVGTFRAFVRELADDRRTALRRSPGGDLQPGSQSEHDEFEELFHRLVQTLDEPVWSHLLNSLPAQLRGVFFSRAGGGGVTEESWSVAYSQLGFTFDCSRGYKVVLAIALGLSMVAVVQAAAIFAGADGAGWIHKSLALLAAGAVVSTWIWMRAGATQAAWGVDYSRYREAVFGAVVLPAMLVLALGEDRGILKELDIWPVAVLFTPGGLWLAVTGLTALVGLPVAIGVVAAAILVGALLEHGGAVREKALKRPFAGIFAGRTLAVEEDAA